LDEGGGEVERRDDGAGLGVVLVADVDGFGAKLH
jgi:hypothetical protein